MEEIFKKKYLKYKKKYLLLKGGAGTFYLYVSGIAQYVDEADVWNTQLKNRILNKILPHFTNIEIRYYDPLFDGKNETLDGRQITQQMIEAYRRLIEQSTPHATVNKFFKERMPELNALPEKDKLTKNNHLILNLADLEYPGMYDRFNILYLGYLVSDQPLLLHIPYLTILSEEQVRRQPSGAARQIILYNDELIINNYVSSNINSYYFLYFYEQIKEIYKRNIDGLFKTSVHRPIIIKIIDFLFENANFLIKLYLLIYKMTATIPQAPLKDKENNIDAIIDILNQRLNNIFFKIDFSKLGGFVLPQIQLDYPPEPLPPPLDNFDELARTYPDIDPEVLKLLCPYRMPAATTTPDRILSLLISPVY